MMSNVARKNRRPKIDLVVLDDDEPQLKITKREPEPLPAAPDVVELQEKLAKAENKIQRLIKIAGDAQSKEEYLESLIDNKPNITVDAKKVEELEKSVSSFKSQLDVALMRQRDMERHIVRQDEDRLQIEREREKDRERINELIDFTNELGKERKRAIENRLKDQQKIEELTSKLAKYEGVQQSVQQMPLPPQSSQLQPPPLFPELQQPPKMQQLQPPPPFPELQPLPKIQQLQQPYKLQQLQQPHKLQQLHKKIVHDTCHQTNILLLCYVSKIWSGAISLDDAIRKLRSSYDSCDVGEFVKFCNLATRKKFECEVCAETMNSFSIIKHFLSKSHIDKVRVIGGAVSSAAVDHWVAVLQQKIPAPGEALSVQLLQLLQAQQVE